MLFSREWYSYHFPELVKIVPDNYTYSKAAMQIKNRKELSEDSLEALEEVVMDSAKAQAIIDAARSSMGMWRLFSTGGLGGRGGIKCSLREVLVPF